MSAGACPEAPGLFPCLVPLPGAPPPSPESAVPRLQSFLPLAANDAREGLSHAGQRCPLCLRWLRSRRSAAPAAREATRPRPQASGLCAHVPLCSLLFAQAVWLGTSALATELKTQPPPTSRPPNRSSDFCHFPHRTSQGWRRPRVSSAGGAAGRGTPGWRGWRPGPRRPGQEKA